MIIRVRLALFLILPGEKTQGTKHTNKISLSLQWPVQLRVVCILLFFILI